MIRAEVVEVLVMLYLGVCLVAVTVTLVKMKLGNCDPGGYVGGALCGRVRSVVVMEVPIMVEGEVGMAVALLVLGKVGHECYLCLLCFGC